MAARRSSGMALAGTVGGSGLEGSSLVEPWETPTSYTWRIRGVTLSHFTRDGPRRAKVGDVIHSPEFEACGHKWKLSAFLGGNKHEHAGYLSVFLHLESPVVVNADFTLHVSGDRFGPRSYSNIFSSRVPAVRESNNGFGNLLSHTRLAASPAKYYPGGVLTITATLTNVRVAAGPSQTSFIAVPPPSLLSELRALLDSCVGTDVSLACGGQSVPAHSFVLSMRSPVFRAQLAPDSPLVAADLSAVPVPEEITPATLRRLLEFIYSDELEPASPEEAGTLQLARCC